VFKNVSPITRQRFPHPDKGTYIFIYKMSHDQNYIHEQIKSSSNSGNSCCHSVQNLLSSSLIRVNIKGKICLCVFLALQPIMVVFSQPGSGL
jgi:hypothetical protein